MSSQENLKSIPSENLDNEAISVEKLRERIQYYQDENAKMDTIIEKLKLLTDEQLKLLSVLEGTSNIDDITANASMLSHEEKLRKHSHYATKVKLCIKMYINLNDKLLSDINKLKSEIENSKANINSLTPKDDVKTLEAKVKRYENELVKLEKKYPWLKDSRLDLPDISEQVDKLNSLRNAKQKIEEDLAAYNGLQPDIAEANKQLKEVKAEYDQLMNEFGKL